MTQSQELKGIWKPDVIMRGWRYWIWVNGTAYRTASVYKPNMQTWEMTLAAQINALSDGRPNHFQKTGESEYTLPGTI